jgi:hypothetical protein
MEDASNSTGLARHGHPSLARGSSGAASAKMSFFNIVQDPWLKGAVELPSLLKVKQDANIFLF